MLSGAGLFSHHGSADAPYGSIKGQSSGHGLVLVSAMPENQMCHGLGSGDALLQGAPQLAA